MASQLTNRGKPPNQGTGPVPFQAYAEKEGTVLSACNVHHQSIPFQYPHHSYSFEELRLGDYNQGRKFGNQDGWAGTFAQSSTADDATEIRDLSGPVVEVLVGTPPKSFHVHEALVRSSSPYFDKAMNGDWKESEERIVRLPVDVPQAFNIYLHWLYGQTVVPVLKKDISAEDVGAHYLLLAQAYTFGEKVRDNGFKDAVLDAIHDQTFVKTAQGSVVYPSTVTHIHLYENTLETDPIRRFLLDLCLDVGSTWFDRNNPSFCDDYPRDFLLDMSNALFKRGLVKPKHRAMQGYTCRYHKHGLNAESCRRRWKLR